MYIAYNSQDESMKEALKNLDLSLLYGVNIGKKRSVYQLKQ